jgi:4-hydroxy-tetrahydrodipicolinate synthase
MKHSLPKGLYTALVTPFKEGKVDFSALEKLLDFQIKSAVQGIVVFGTTGEGATLSEEEKFEIAKFAINFVKGKVKIIAGTGGNNTLVSAELTAKISTLNPDGFLVVSPFYNKATSEGLLLHFKEIAGKTELPIILYNVPGRTNMNISDDIIQKLHESQKNIIGLKDATGDLSRVPSVRSKVGKDFLLLSGEDATALAFNASGGDGVISVASNVAPKLCLELQNISLSRNNLETAFEIQEKIFKISEVLFSEVNPIPVKYALYLMNFCLNEYRLPLCQPSENAKEKIKNILTLCS